MVGEAEPNFAERMALLRCFIDNILPDLRLSFLATDQELIDMAAEEFGLHKADVNCMLENWGNWKAKESVLPDGYTYDIGAFYLKRTDEEKLRGSSFFTLDAPTGFWLLDINSIYEYTLYGGAGSSGGGSSSSADYVYSPDDKYEVVRYDGGDNFTTVSRTTLTAWEPRFFYFRPENDYCFGYNTYSEMSSGVGPSSAYGGGWKTTEECPLRPPVITEVKCDTGGLTVTWEAVDGAERYRAFVKGDTDWIAIGDTTGTSITYSGCTSGNGATFMVRCVSADGKQYKSLFTEDFSKSGHYIAAPAVVSIRSLPEGNEITWNPVPGNAKFRVFAKKPGKIFKAIGDTFGTSFIHSLQDGETYVYTVCCISFSGQNIVSGLNKTGWTKAYTPDNSEPEYQSVIGDTDGDGELTACDAAFIQRFAADIDIPFPMITELSDIDGDGDVTVMDASLIQSYLAEAPIPYKINEKLT